MGSNSKLAEQIMASVPPETYRKAVRLLTTFDRRKELADIKVPTLVIAVSDDTTAPAAMMERMAQKIPGAEYVLLEGCGHLGPMDQPDAFNAVLSSFLRRRVGARPGPSLSQSVDRQLDGAECAGFEPHAIAWRRKLRAHQAAGDHH